MAVVDVELLGRPGVRRSGERIELKGRQPALLAALAISAPRPVAADTLADVVWGEDLPADPANALQQRISALRRSLDPERAGQILVTAPGAYALHEFESSKLTNTHTHGVVPQAEFGYNEKCSFGKLIFDTTAADPEVVYEIWSIDNERVYRYRLPLSALER